MKQIGIALIVLVALTGCDPDLVKDIKQTAKTVQQVAETAKAVSDQAQTQQSRSQPTPSQGPPQQTQSQTPFQQAQYQPDSQQPIYLHGKKIKEIIAGTVVGVSDGDTITLKPHNQDKTVRIRLASIDTPEKRQDFGQRAKQRMSELVFNRQVEVYSTDTDRYGRVIGYVMIGDWSANLQMVADGLAWHYKHYCDDASFEHNEKVAQSNRYGLWVDPRAVPPWEWRKQNKRR